MWEPSSALEDNDQGADHQWKEPWQGIRDTVCVSHRSFGLCSFSCSSPFIVLDLDWTSPPTRPKPFPSPSPHTPPMHPLSHFSWAVSKSVQLPPTPVCTSRVWHAVAMPGGTVWAWDQIFFSWCLRAVFSPPAVCNLGTLHPPSILEGGSALVLVSLFSNTFHTFLQSPGHFLPHLFLPKICFPVTVSGSLAQVWVQQEALRVLWEDMQVRSPLLFSTISFLFPFVSSFLCTYLGTSRNTSLRNSTSDPGEDIEKEMTEEKRRGGILLSWCMFLLLILASYFCSFWCHKCPVLVRA